MFHKVNITKSTLPLVGCSSSPNQTPRGPTEPAHVNKYPRTTHSESEPHCTLCHPPTHTQRPSPHHCHIQKSNQASGSTQLQQMPPTGPFLHKAQASPELILDHSYHLSREETGVARDAPWLLNRSLKAIHHLCPFLHYIPDDHMAFEE